MHPNKCQKELFYMHAMEQIRFVMKQMIGIAVEKLHLQKNRMTDAVYKDLIFTSCRRVSASL